MLFRMIDEGIHELLRIIRREASTQKKAGFRAPVQVLEIKKVLGNLRDVDGPFIQVKRLRQRLDGHCLDTQRGRS